MDILIPPTSPSNTLKLSIDLTPTSTSCKNIQKQFNKKQWAAISDMVFSRTQGLCEICGAPIDKKTFKMYACWLYNGNTQSLSKLIGLCFNCNQAKDRGIVALNADTHYVVEHYCRVNNISYEEALKHIENAFDVWCQRSHIEWVLDTQKILAIQQWADKKIIETEAAIKAENQQE